MLKNKLLSAMGGSEPSDPNFKNTVLLLHGDGTNGAQNKTFVDSSINNFTITRNGNTTQGSFSPFSKEPGKWGVAFDGNGDYLALSSAAALTLGTGDFTIEAWVYLAGHPGSNIVLDMRTSGVLTAPVLYWNGTGFVWYGNQSTLIAGSAYNPNNQWTHVAVCKSSGSTRLFVNGVQSGSTYTDSLNYPCGQVRIGASFSPGDGWLGNISNLRVVKGTALYTSNFTPPTAPLTAVAGTSLLCCQDNRFKDNSPNNFTLSPNGNVAVTPFSPFANSAAYNPAVNGGSGYFDGGGDYLTPSADPLNFGTGAFTIEAWIYLTGTPSGNLGNAIIGGSVDSASRIFFGVSRSGVTSGKLTVEQYGVGVIVTSSTAIALNTWYHAAVSRDSSGNYRLFVNGTQEASNSNSNSVGTGGAYIGSASTGGGTANNPFQGYIANLRTVTGTAVYTASFTPPTAPVTAITNTRLLLNFTNAAIFDNAMINNLGTLYNAQISTSVKKYGTGAMYFDGSGDYLAVPYSPNVKLPSGDWTIEFWMYCTGAQSGSANAVWIQDDTGGYSGILVSANSSRQVQFTSSTSGSSWNYLFQTIGTYTDNTWAHVAICKSGSTVYGFFNGSLNLTINSFPATIYSTTNQSTLGTYSTSYFNGYIDDFRITKGVARYTANFTPPAQAFPNK